MESTETIVAFIGLFGCMSKHTPIGYVPVFENKNTDKNPKNTFLSVGQLKSLAKNETVTQKQRLPANYRQPSHLNYLKLLLLDKK